jgi:hypothetical protein
MTCDGGGRGSVDQSRRGSPGVAFAELQHCSCPHDASLRVRALVRRYDTWNEIFVYADIITAASVGEASVMSNSADKGGRGENRADAGSGAGGGGGGGGGGKGGGGGGGDAAAPHKVSTHVFLGQLPTVEHMRELQYSHRVTCVVSCVEEFELKQYNLNFPAMGLAHCILPQVRSFVLWVAAVVVVAVC